MTIQLGKGKLILGGVMKHPGKTNPDPLKIEELRFKSINIFPINNVR